MLRFMFFLILCYLLYRLIRALLRVSMKRDTGITPFDERHREDEMVKDPYCEVYIPIRDAYPGKVGGEDLYFCSKECLEKYKRERA